jgi:hypothetical protein
MPYSCVYVHSMQYIISQEVTIGGARQRVDPALLSDEELQQKLSQVLSQATSKSVCCCDVCNTSCVLVARKMYATADCAAIAVCH